MNIELCVGSYKAIEFANKFQFSRIELCENLEVGGTTPSTGFQKFAHENCKKDIHVLIRPRIGNFIYSDEEKQIQLLDCESALNLNCKGLVVGALMENGNLDLDFLRELKTKFPNTDFTFHRAFDEIPKKLEAIKFLKELGFQRILTSGSKSDIISNLVELKDLVAETKKNEIELMCGGGINESNIKEIVKYTNTNAIHFSGTILEKELDSGKFSVARLVPNQNKISAIWKEIETF